MPRKKQNRNRCQGRKPRKHRNHKKHRNNKNKCNTQTLPSQAANQALDNTDDFEARYQSQTIQAFKKLQAAASSENEQQYARMNDQDKTAMLLSLIGRDFPNAANSGKVPPSAMKVIWKHFDTLNNEQDIASRVGELERKYGIGALVVVYDYPQDVKKNKLSKMSSIFSYMAMKDEKTIFSPYLSWISKKQIRQHLYDKDLDKIECKNQFGQGKSVDCIEAFIFVYNNPILEIVQLFKSWVVLPGKFTQSVSDSIENKTAPSYRSLKSAAPNLAYMIDSISKNEKEAQDCINQIFTQALIENEAQMKSDKQTIESRTNFWIDFVCPPNLCDLVPSDFDKNKKKELKLLVESIRGDDVNRNTSSKDSGLKPLIESALKDYYTNLSKPDKFKIIKVNDEKKSNDDHDNPIHQLINHPVLQIPVIRYDITEKICGLFENTSVNYWQIIIESLTTGGLYHPALQQYKMMQSATKKIARKAKGNYCDGCGVLESYHKKQGNKSFEKCSRCNSVWYCSRKCQKNHWMSGHKDVCKQL